MCLYETGNSSKHCLAKPPSIDPVPPRVTWPAVSDPTRLKLPLAISLKSGDQGAAITLCDKGTIFFLKNSKLTYALSLDAYEKSGTTPIEGEWVDFECSQKTMAGISKAGKVSAGKVQVELFSLRVITRVDDKEKLTSKYVVGKASEKPGIGKSNFRKLILFKNRLLYIVLGFKLKSDIENPMPVKLDTTVGVWEVGKDEKSHTERVIFKGDKTMVGV